MPMSPGSRMLGYLVPGLLALLAAVLFVPLWLWPYLAFVAVVVSVCGVAMVAWRDHSERNAPD